MPGPSFAGRFGKIGPYPPKRNSIKETVRGIRRTAGQPDSRTAGQESSGVRTSFRAETKSLSFSLKWPCRALQSTAGSCEPSRNAPRMQQAAIRRTDSARSPDSCGKLRAPGAHAAHRTHPTTCRRSRIRHASPGASRREGKRAMTATTSSPVGRFAFFRSFASDIPLPRPTTRMARARRKASQNSRI